MAVNNRDEAIISVNTDMVPTIEAPELRLLLNDEILNSIVFRKDVIASETPVAGAVTINYLNKDTATVVTAVNLAVSFTNIENGDVKYLHITKAAANTISFVGAIDVSMNKAYINTIATVVIYQISYKNGVICVESINIDNNRHGGTITGYLDIPAWDMVTNVFMTIPFPKAVTKMLSYTAIIYLNGQSVSFMLGGADINGLGTGIVAFNNASGGSFVLSRTTGGFFDSTFFNSLLHNRGVLKIEYLP